MRGAIQPLVKWRESGQNSFEQCQESAMFENCIAIVTGGESGIGAACAKALGDAGARVVITYFKDLEAAQTVCRSIGDEAPQPLSESYRTLATMDQVSRSGVSRTA